MTIDTRILSSIDECPSTQWDRLFTDDYPFLQHRFLSLLESSGSVCTETGWEPRHLLLEQAGEPIAALPLYLKSHSWGEYVFDWSWADAYQNHGLDYYPKLLTAVPFTPATGPRLGLGSGIVPSDVLPSLFNTIQEIAENNNLSSWHLLFPNQPLATAGAGAGAQMMSRTGVQYHWINANYRDFADFTDTFSSRKRKNLYRERRSVSQQALSIQRLTGERITSDWWAFFYQMYQRTYLKRNGTGGYLTEAFFQQLGQVMGDQLMMAVAQDEEGNKIAAALFFYDNQTLYGRYWGCIRECDSLHFELCYYQGIEFAIERGLSRFDAGAQGEHKIKRGFEPVETHSLHWIKHPEFSAAIRRFLAQEKQHIGHYIIEAKQQLPYRSDKQ
ncbi:MAG: GNAT family N-acetyltransferase [Porticoccus sp.]